jgi:hypothetical protein
LIKAESHSSYNSNSNAGKGKSSAKNKVTPLEERLPWERKLTSRKLDFKDSVVKNINIKNKLSGAVKKIK